MLKVAIKKQPKKTEFGVGIMEEDFMELRFLCKRIVFSF